MDRSVRKCRKLSIFGYRRTTTTSFEMLPEVPLLKILSKLDTEDLVNMSQVSKSWNQRICQIRLKNSSFWSDRIAKSTGEFWSRFVRTNIEQNWRLTDILVVKIWKTCYTEKVDRLALVIPKFGKIWSKIFPWIWKIFYSEENYLKGFATKLEIMMNAKEDIIPTGTGKFYDFQAFIWFL